MLDFTSIQLNVGDGFQLHFRQYANKLFQVSQITGNDLIFGRRFTTIVPDEFVITPQVNTKTIFYEIALYAFQQNGQLAIIPEAEMISGGLGCLHTTWQGDNYGASCYMCDRQLEGYGFGGFFGSRLTEERVCIHKAVQWDDSDLLVCQYCDLPIVPGIHVDNPEIHTSLGSCADLPVTDQEDEEMNRIGGQI
jgi:hypothetical protein